MVITRNIGLVAANLVTLIVGETIGLLPRLPPAGSEVEIEILLPESSGTKPVGLSRRLTISTRLPIRCLFTTPTSLLPLGIGEVEIPP